MRWEENVLLWVQNKVRNDFLTPIFQVISLSTDKGIIWILISIVLSLAPASRRIGLVSLITLLAEFIVVNLFIKQSVARIRPFQAVEKLRVLVKEPHDFSFPSGHTACAFAGAAAIFLAGYKRTGIGLSVYAALVGFSRIYLGVHYLTDVLAGAFIGIIVAYGVHVAVG